VSNSLSKAEILRGKDSFLHVFQCGTSIDTVHIRGIFTSEAGKSPHGGIRVGFAIKRGLLNGVQRNRLKRLMRESYRTNKNILASSPMQTNVALVFLYSPKSAAGAAKVSLGQIETDVKRILSKLASKL
jgi:ribonuclease P protein component